LLILSLSPLISSLFDESESIRLFHLSAAAYGDRIQDCVNKAHPNEHKWELWSSSHEICDILSHNCAFLIAHSEMKNETTIAFRGTSSKTQLFVEGWQSLTPAVDFFGMGLVNRYFITAHLSMWSGIEEYLKDPQYKHHSISFTGHSLGGALAALAAARTVKQGFRPSHRVKVYTFGEPRVGSLNFARSFDALVPESYRIVNARDVVPHLPPCEKNEAGAKNNVSPCDDKDVNGSYHHGTEIWVPGSVPGTSDAYRICTGLPKNEDFSCSDKLKFRIDDLGDSVGEHREYYGVKVSTHGHSGCKTTITGVFKEEEGTVDRVVSKINSFFRRIGFNRKYKASNGYLNRAVDSQFIPPTMLFLLVSSLLISTISACAPHKPMISSRPVVHTNPEPNPVPNPVPNPDPNPDPNPVPNPGPEPGPPSISSKLLPDPDMDCPILSPSISTCISLFTSLGESHPSDYCASPIVNDGKEFICPEDKPVMLVFDEVSDVDMYLSVSCDHSNGVWKFEGEAEKKSSEFAGSLTVTCVNPNHTG
ncbi:hypothetical protein PFISCL1PPCAC_2251, partial [Pristionchus fissidentatus]